MPTERFQNPTTNDTIRLRLFTYNSNNFRSVSSISKVTIYKLDSGTKTEVESFDGGSVVAASDGEYYLDITTTSPKYTIGDYVDVWTMVFEEGENEAEVENAFTIYPDLWVTTPIPIVYDFNFRFSPTMIPKGSKKHLIIEIAPNVPKACDLERYYYNLAVVADIKISIEAKCGPCLPAESDLRLVVDEDTITFREKCYGYYFLDTTEMDCGIYNVWFKMEFGNNVFVSEKQQLQIFS